MDWAADSAALIRASEAVGTSVLAIRAILKAKDACAALSQGQGVEGGGVEGVCG